MGYWLPAVKTAIRSDSRVRATCDTAVLQLEPQVWQHQ